MSKAQHARPNKGNIEREYNAKTTKVNKNCKTPAPQKAEENKGKIEGKNEPGNAEFVSVKLSSSSLMMLEKPEYGLSQ